MAYRFLHPLAGSGMPEPQQRWCCPVGPHGLGVPVVPGHGVSAVVPLATATAQLLLLPRYWGYRCWGEMSSIGGLSRSDGRSCPSPGGCQGLGEVSRGTGVYGFPTAPGPSDRCSPIDPFDRHRWVSAAPGPRSCRGEMGGGGSHPPPAVPPPWCRAGRARCSAAVRRVPGGLRGGIYSPLPAAAAPLAVVQSCH